MLLVMLIHLHKVKDLVYYPTGLTSTQFQINVGSNPHTHDYISGGTVTFEVAHLILVISFMMKAQV